MNLPEFVDKLVGEERGGDLIESGLGARRLFEYIGDQELTRAILATNFWRAWLASDLSRPLLTSLGASPGALARSRTVIVWRENVNRFDLVVLDPALFPDFTPRATSLNLEDSVESIMRGAVRSFVDSPIPRVGTDAPRLAVEISADYKNNPFAVILAREPALERLSVPSSPLEVDNLKGEMSTAGAMVQDSIHHGRVGVTAALHAVETASVVTVSTPFGKVTGSVIRTDSVTDSAFIEAPIASVSTRSVKGVMSGMAPRGKQKAEFIGLISKSCSTVVVAWDSQIPNPSSRRQACIYTPRDAQPGDSGSALITDDDWIVGFAFERSKPGEDPEQCSWIWAESVLNRLNVTLK
jgi:hypothetical protein